MGIRTVLAFLTTAAVLSACYRDVRPRRAGDAWRVACRASAEETVAVTGDFAGWAPVKHLSRDFNDGLWYVKVVLPPGIHRIACESGRRVFAPEGFPMYENDGFGGSNGVLFVPGDLNVPEPLH